MIIDTLDNLDRYTLLHPLFAQVIGYLKANDLTVVEPGTNVQLKGEDLVINFAQAGPKTREQAKLETHVKFIDIQIPLSDVEIMGYTPAKRLTKSHYDTEKDISFYEGIAENYIKVTPGMFVIFFPEDAHAPAISPHGIRKVIVKVRV